MSSRRFGARKSQARGLNLNRTVYPYVQYMGTKKDRTKIMNPSAVWREREARERLGENFIEHRQDIAQAVPCMLVSQHAQGIIEAE